ncbi:MAG: DMT family transporter [Chloroflexi bacterium]|nr:MAG: DMT family transporter [Chloroflexota bacterium]
MAAAALYLVLRFQGRNLPGPGRIWKNFAVMGFFSNALPFALFSWGEQYIDSALAAILNGTTPLFTILLAHIFIGDDRLTLPKLGGVLLGFSGLVLLILPALFDGVHATTLGLLALTVAAASYGVAIVYSRLNLRGLPPLVAPTAQLAMATVYLLPLSLLVEQPYRLPLPSWTSAGSLIALALVGTALAFVLYYRIIEHTSATYLSMVTYLVPIFGVTLGVVVLNEQLQWNAYAGCALILVGVMAVNGLFNGLKNWMQRPAGSTARP